ncbi:MAG: hypothetical protein H0U85_07035 [Gemmatimonadales bacterium]|nr:hypothetical protein [Gemmatimonadales bacterium]
MATEDRNRDIEPDAEMTLDEAETGALPDTAEGDSYVPSGTGAPELAMPDDQGDGADDRHTDRDGPNERASHRRTDR